MAMSTETSVQFELSLGLRAELELAYANPPRAYHNFSHVTEVLRHFDRVTESVGWDQPLEVWVAILFHDAVYVPGRKDNETLSAVLALEAVVTHQLNVNAQRVKELIELTAQHGALNEASGDTALFLDCDMAILGSRADTFARYDAAIAQEYAHVPKLIYQFNRRRFLAKLLASPRIFLSDFFHKSLDAQARLNLKAALG
jgi:predicted metal-dependent HD superfamily phosphohydrolase